MDLAGDDGFGLNFDFSRGFDDAVETATDDDVVAVDLTFDFSVLAEDKGLVRDEISLHCGVDAKGAGGLQAALELDPLFEEASPFTGI